MFLDALSKVGSATVTIPLAIGHSSGVMIQTGVALPSIALGGLSDLASKASLGPVESLAKSLFEAQGKTLTGHWMDCTGPFSTQFPEGLSKGLHRIRNHHFLTDALTVFDNPELNVVDFYSHLATDIVTKNGLPILPETITRSIADICNIPLHKVVPWTSLNFLDVGSSVFAVYDSVSNVTSLVTGELQWGLNTAFNTIGLGSGKIAGGLYTANPILVTSGVTDVTCGVVSAHQYYSQDFIFGVPVNDLLSGASMAGVFAGALGVLEVYIKRNKLTTKEKSLLMTERIGTASLLGALSVISAPLSMSVAMGITGVKLAKRSVGTVQARVDALPHEAPFSNLVDHHIVENHIDPKVLARIRKHFGAAKDQTRLNIL